MKKHDHPPILYSGNTLDRAANLRDQPDALARLKATPGAQALLFHDGQVLTTQGGLCWTPVHDLPADTPTDEMIFLGLADGQPRYALSVDSAPSESIPDSVEFLGIRQIVRELPVSDTGLLAQAASLVSWHQTHWFCAQCGHPSDVVQGGWSRHCPSCGAKHFPRTDPVVIMLLTHQDRVLLAGKPIFPPELLSLIAGFVEPGETLEEASRRETLEETGLEVNEVRYLCSQPWPFPSQLMIGVAVEATHDQFVLEAAELDRGRWVSREQLQAAFAGQGAFMAPRMETIARVMLEAWISENK